MKGLYRVYFTAAMGSSIGVFYLGGGIIEGVDVGGMAYQGSYEQDHKDAPLIGVVNFVVPPNTTLITGFTAGSTSIALPVPINIPANFASGEVIRFETPTGPVNARFELARALT